VTSFADENAMSERVSNLRFIANLNPEFGEIKQELDFKLYVRYHCWKASI
jgi:hypothetical protein